MKRTIKNVAPKISLLFFGLLSGMYAFAQDASTTQSESNTTVSHTQSTTQVPDAAMWYTNPIVWVIGAAVLLIVIILAVRSGGGSSSSTTTTRDGGISRTSTSTTTVRED